MIISHSQLQEVLKVYGSSITKAEKAEKSKAKGQERLQGPDKTAIKDSLSLSGQAREVQRAKELARQAPEVRRDRVEDIKGQIEAGTYNVSGEKIAAKLVSRLLVNELL